MRHERWFWIGGFLAGFSIGLALSLIYTWLIDPPPFTYTTPAALQAQDKEIYTVLIAAAYVADGDLERAKERLAALEDPEIEQTVVVLAESYIHAGRDARDVRALARLADALGGTSAAMRPFIATPTPTRTPTPTPTPYPPTPTPTRVIRHTPTPTVTPTSRPTSAAQPVDIFEVVQSTALCDPGMNGLLRVYVRDQEGRGLPGLAVRVTWAGGEDRFFTGFKPEADPGYADFDMEPDEDYEVRLAERDSHIAPVGADLADLCPGLPSGVRPSWQVVFQLSK